MTGPAPEPPRTPPDRLTLLSFVLLAALALLLLWPLVTGGRAPNPWLVGGLLLLRLGLQVLRAQRDERLKRPVSWAFDLLLIGLILYTASNQPPG